MRLALEQDERITSSIRAVHPDHLSTLSRKYVGHRQRFLCDLLSISYERRHVHEVDPEADAFSRASLLKGLRVSATKEVIPTYLRDLYPFEESNRGYDRDAGLTKAYRMRDSVRMVLDEVYSTRDSLPVEGQEVFTKSENGLPSEMAGQDLFVPAHLPVSEEDLVATEDRIRGWMEPDNHQGLLDPHKSGGMTLQGALQIIRSCRMWQRSYGGFPNLYRLQSYGRLGPRGGSIHVITLPRTIRQLVFHHSGLEDFDLVSCHWSILTSLARAMGLKTPWIDAYRENKEEWHRSWAGATCLYPSDLKPITSSWLTGGVLSSSPHTAGVRAVGREMMTYLQKDHRAQALYKETRDTLGRVIPQVTEYVRDGGRTVVVNAVGQARETQGLSRRKVFSHVLTGFEQFAIRTACQRVRDLQAVVYDGFIAPPQDVVPLQAAIREESSKRLGLTLRLQLKRKPFSDPIVDRRAFDPDFDYDYLKEIAAA